MTVKTITCEALQQLLDQESALIIDMRDRLSFKCGHLPDAINRDESNLKILLDNVSKTLPILTYCEEGDQSSELAQLFSDHGFERCYSLHGGYEAWAVWQAKFRDLRDDLCAWLDKHGFDCKYLDARGYNGETALMHAARKGELEYVLEILDRDVDLELRNNDGNSAVWLACYGNNPLVLEALIDAGADLDVQNDNGASPLIYAASAGRLAMVKLLVQAGADISLTTLDDFSAEDVAATPAILRYLQKAARGQIPLEKASYFRQVV